MLKLSMIEKPGPTNFILVITSSNVEEKVFLEGLYNLRALPSKITQNEDGSVTVEITY